MEGRVSVTDGGTVVFAATGERVRLQAMDEPESEQLRGDAVRSPTAAWWPS